MDASMEVGMKQQDQKMGLEETELRLGIGLPGKGGADNTSEGGGEVARKRGFCETQTETETDNNSSTTVDLMLNLSSSPKQSCAGRQADPTHNNNFKDNTLLPADPAKPPPKAQVVGWPPVRSFRKNMLGVEKKKGEEVSNGGSMVKVSMDGAPYLRKVDLKMYNSYQHLSDALANMFSSFTIGNCGGSQGLKDFMNESKLMDLLNSSDYVPTYEDKDGDWMLVGDVPWEMFVESCKRLRIMKGKEAIGLAPRAMEKCKNRS